MNANLTLVKKYLCKSVGLLFFIAISTGYIVGQSTNIRNPTPLTTNVISGVFDKNTKDNIYRYYSFSANEGDVTINATAERNKNIDVPLNAASLEFTIYDSNLEIIAQKLTGFGGGFDRGEKSVTVKIDRRTTLVLGIKVLAGSVYLGVGKYNLQINGADINSSKDNKKAETETNFQKQLRQIEEEAKFSHDIIIPNEGTLLMTYSQAPFLIKINSIKKITIYDPTSQFRFRKLNYGEMTFPQQGRLKIILKDQVASLDFNLSQIDKFVLVEGIIQISLDR